MQCKIYASDEGYGHLVRQHAILEELRRLCPHLEVTLQTQRNLETARRLYEDVKFSEKFNNIAWPKTREGTPDLDKIRAFYCDYRYCSDEYIRAEGELGQYDFVVSDFVYEAFPAAARSSVPAFGVAHFTWDWFFSKLYPIPVSTAILQRWRTYALSADALFFPPFTPADLLRAYRSKAVETPLIVRRQNAPQKLRRDGRFNVLVMDSGTNVISRSIARGLAQVGELSDYHFFFAETFDIRGDNITPLNPTTLFADYIPQMDLVLTRGGFNTVSECIAYRTPMLLTGEPINPEMQSNLFHLKQSGLGSFVSVEQIAAALPQTLRDFVEFEYNHLLRAMQQHEMPVNGAEVVAEYILNYVGAGPR